MIKIGTLDITGIIKQGGINESTEKASGDNNSVKGAYAVHTFSLSCVTDAEKASIEKCVYAGSIALTIDEDISVVRIERYSASILTEQADIKLWDISMTLRGIDMIE